VTWHAFSAVKKKAACRIRNWGEYNASLKQRGSGAIWVSSEAVANLRRVRKVVRKQWKREGGYHRRSLAETTVFGFKTIFGGQPQSRQIDNQFKELLLKSAILNQMTHLGMPDSVKFAA